MPIVSEEIDRIELPGDEWAEIKRRMSFDDITRLENEIAKIRLKAKRGDDRTLTVNDIEDIEIKSAKHLLLEINLKAWGVKDSEGNIVLLNKENIKKLDPDTADAILTEIDKRAAKKV